jgi:hypothetical protein
MGHPQKNDAFLGWAQTPRPEEKLMFSFHCPNCGAMLKAGGNLRARRPRPAPAGRFNPRQAHCRWRRFSIPIQWLALWGRFDFLQRVHHQVFPEPASDRPSLENEPERY